MYFKGYKIFQLKLGRDLSENVKQIRACKEAMEPQDILIGDPKGGKNNDHSSIAEQAKRAERIHLIKCWAKMNGYFSIKG